MKYPAYAECKIKFVPLYAVGIYHRTKCDIIPKVYHPFRQERISLKNDKFLSNLSFFMACPTGFGLARPTRQGLAALDSPPDCQFTTAPLRILSSKKKKAHTRCTFFFFGLPDRIRTCDLQSRSLTRYPAEPRADIRMYF